ncbi:hypothetical protein ACFOLJ_15765 [Rugamonas sp. CCM 8940]|uniref:hypothetical protein n=1 Tax=Rugamonas sp. CCM 8940 TaxID=2765359 RepID=UPI0018F37702|nr:hypothetical protein [Rugamonas sp. CCM 8940]MBJ7311091.1 hypothetical protein [Rugamonas sp. CCM 8940]
MHKLILPLLLGYAGTAASAASLTEVETRWLSAGAPVLAYAKQLQLPIDIIVQPQAGANDVPLAMGFDHGRCKLVLSMRGNPQAESILDSAPAAQRALLIEAIVAHEVGHCWRYAQGSWHVLPTGFVEVGHAQAERPELPELSQEMRQTRREEGFSDLLALAWTARRHPGAYAEVHQWLSQLRRDAGPAGASHDTSAWLQLARDSTAFAAADTPFEQVTALWNKGLLGGD